MKTTTLLLGAGAAVAMLAARKAKQTSGVGAVLWDYAAEEVERAGIDLSKSYFELSWSDASEVARIGRKFGYRATDNGRSYGRNFWYALKRKNRIPE